MRWETAIVGNRANTEVLGSKADNTNPPLLFMPEAVYARFLFVNEAFADLYLVNNEGSPPLWNIPVKPEEHDSLSLSSIKL